MALNVAGTGLTETRKEVPSADRAVDTMYGVGSRRHPRSPDWASDLARQELVRMASNQYKEQYPHMVSEVLSALSSPDRTEPDPVDDLSTVAQPLGYFSLASGESMIVRHRSLRVRVLLPETMVVLSPLVIFKLKGRQKGMKGILTARDSALPVPGHPA